MLVKVLATVRKAVVCIAKGTYVGMNAWRGDFL